MAQTNSVTWGLGLAPAVVRNCSNSRNFAGNICCLSCENQGNWRACFRAAYATSPASLGDMPRMSGPTLPARDVLGQAHARAVRIASENTFLVRCMFLLPLCAPKYDS